MGKIIAIGTAVPEHKYKQKELANYMHGFCQLSEAVAKWLEGLYAKTGINERNSVLSDFYANAQDPELFKIGANPSVSERMKAYRQHYLPLALSAVHHTRTQLHNNGTSIEKVTHLITVSCTGMAAPGIDIELQKTLALPADTVRLSVNFMGCYAVFHALKIAQAITSAQPDAMVLIVSVELCSLHFQPSHNRELMAANALFADGAAALVVTSDFAKSEKGFSLASMYAEVIPDSESDMAWNINEDGFLMSLSSLVPQQIKDATPQLMNKLCYKAGISVSDIKHWAIHPGGPKILEAFQEAIEISKEKLSNSYAVLAQNGNMSSPTIAFVLEQFWNNYDLLSTDELIFAAGFGPGLTVETALFSVQ